MLLEKSDEDAIVDKYDPNSEHLKDVPKKTLEKRVRSKGYKGCHKYLSTRFHGAYGIKTINEKSQTCGVDVLRKRQAKSYQD